MSYDIAYLGKGVHMKIFKKLFAAWCAAFMTGCFWLITLSPALLISYFLNLSKNIAFVVFFINLTIVVTIGEYILKRKRKKEKN